jgi:hypothetical protein
VKQNNFARAKVPFAVQIRRDSLHAFYCNNGGTACLRSGEETMVQLSLILTSKRGTPRSDAVTVRQLGCILVQ